jgi:hypothetical protein
MKQTDNPTGAAYSSTRESVNPAYDKADILCATLQVATSEGLEAETQREVAKDMRRAIRTVKQELDSKSPNPVVATEGLRDASETAETLEIGWGSRLSRFHVPITVDPNATRSVTSLVDSIEQDLSIAQMHADGWADLAAV